MKSFDVVIIGGGPAGSSLGYMLKSSGFSTCIIEKEKFPRFKLCGGLLTEKTIALIEKIYNRPFYKFRQKTSEVAMYLGSKKIINVQTDANFYMVDRMEFDKYLMDLYTKSGGVLIEKCFPLKVDTEGHIIETSIGENIGFRILVGADGANSKIRKLIDTEYRPNGFCIESTFERAKSKNKINLFFNLNNNGYSWIFPKGDRTAIGLGKVVDRTINISKEFDIFASSVKIPNMIIDKKNGAFIPYGKYVKNPCKGDILLVGDAAGLVDPVTGEGIYFALKSAELAKQSIIATKSNNYVDMDSVYMKKIKSIHKRIDDGNFLNSILFNRKLIKRIVFTLLRGKSNFISYVCKNLISNYKTSYRWFALKYLMTK